MSLVFAISNLHDLILQIGSYAGLAAVLGLGVLSALYFSQARDVKRLREWAGRAPERSLEHQIGGRPATQAAQAQQAAQAAQPAPAARPGAPAAAPTPAAGAAAPARPPQVPPATAQPGTAAASPAAGGGGTATATPPRTGPPPVTPSPRTLPSTGGQTAILSPPSRAMDEGPWYRRITWPEPRYIALIVAGVLILGAAAAYGITQLTSSSSSPSSSDQGQAAPGASGSSQGSKSSKPAPVDPSKVTVAVLNGTRIPGLAAHVGDRVQSNGFQLGNVATATEAQRAESVVEFKSGSNRAARLVARKLHITQIEPLDPSSGDQGLTGNAQVLVIVGADQQRGSSSTGTGSTGGGSTGTGTGTGGAGTGTGTPGTGTPGAGGTATSP